MRGVLKGLLRVSLLLALAMAAVALWKKDDITRLMAVNSLFDADRIVENFSHMDRAFLTKPVPLEDAPIFELPEGPQMPLPEGVQEWITERSVTSLVVLQGGQLVHESYHLGTGPDDRRISWSVAKSWLSLLLGQLLAEGVIPSIDVAVSDYIPGHQSSAYDGVTLRQTLQMMSGVAFDEDYLDRNSDINRMGRAIALGGTLDGFAQGLTERRAAPGESWQYTSIDTHVVGQVIRSATGRTIPELLSERLFQPMGLEAEPYYLTDGEGVAFVLGGLNMTTRDYARMGLLIAQEGKWRGEPLVPADWIAQSIEASAPTPPGQKGFGYHWWIPLGARPGEVAARGIYGQYVWIDQTRGIVIASNAADRAFRDAGIDAANIEMFRKIATSLETKD
ncbi:serine hydrolase domain-containing protein [Primorskyibacter sp. S187A]|uniref:serine hydrolase domain-containing protein n=1 Tax=Primorskyibacter sp. S187A TaxID=3415130 RepID=UPI003C7A9670